LESALTLERVAPYHPARATSLVVGRGTRVEEELPRTYRGLVQAML
jgi:hypothetical protein